jgi:hypothetical protein
MVHAISLSKLKWTKILFTTAARTMPRHMQMSHAGKNEPRILKVGARLQPVIAHGNNITSAAFDLSERRTNPIPSVDEFDFMAQSSPAGSGSGRLCEMRG